MTETKKVAQIPLAPCPDINCIKPYIDAFQLLQTYYTVCLLDQISVKINVAMLIMYALLLRMSMCVCICRAPRTSHRLSTVLSPRVENVPFGDNTLLSNVK